ncbi:Putative aliphatic sulfonates-binding protein [Sporomusa silvacetica DSM 10669]|uniref:Aliphatic sulfonates-binding protein n=1 Tax=Sporomusa silvacetica DSM 10669 TaxID=1123289 RepID=A0ABZ3IRS4_9FIRM|nr:MetQ/NlpA family ABC transporter substrate-binding protein [Sporomusa silvacetica]OZC15323.1 putative aliphatic sulfonates-binding protein precursor [Sporomusa silvacetica DSM 10669]
MKKNVVLITIALLLLVLAGCASEKKENTVQKQGQLQNITIGLMPDVDSIPFIIAQEKGYFKEEGITVTLKPFKSAMERDSALQSGNLDGAISDVLAEAFAKAGGFDTVITALTNGSYKLVVNKSETAASVQDLKGKNVAISKNTIIEYVTDRIATEGGLTTTDMNKTVIPQIPARLEMLQNNKISAATLPDPLATVAVKNGGRVINASEQLGINPGVMLFTTKAINEKEQEIQAMYRAYNKAVDYLAREPMDSYIDMVIEKAGFPQDVKGALILPKYKKATAPQQKDIDDVITWMQSRQLIQQKYQYTELVDTRFVR